MWRQQPAMAPAAPELTDEEIIEHKMAEFQKPDKYEYMMIFDVNQGNIEKVFLKNLRDTTKNPIRIKYTAKEILREIDKVYNSDEQTIELENA